MSSVALKGAHASTLELIYWTSIHVRAKNKLGSSIFGSMTEFKPDRKVWIAKEPQCCRNSISYFSKYRILPYINAWDAIQAGFLFSNGTAGLIDSL